MRAEMISSANHKLTEHFRVFFKRLNPSDRYEEAAVSGHSTARALIEDSDGPAGDLRIRTFLQGSYRRDTAIHSINDVDVVALCSLSHKPSANRTTRDQIFDFIASALASDPQFGDKLDFHSGSVCIKILLELVKVEILPALRVQGQPFESEPFYMFDPDDPSSSHGVWRKAFARRHQELCSRKNARTEGRWIPIVKCLKHLRSIDDRLADTDAVSFHVECLLFAIRDAVYKGSTADCLEAVLGALAAFTPDKAVESGIRSPSGDKLLFNVTEWDVGRYQRFNEVAQTWHSLSREANGHTDKIEAVRTWRLLLGSDYFPESVS